MVAAVQAEAASFATRQAARDAARAFVTGSSLADARSRAAEAARLAFSSQGIDVTPSVTFRLGTSCDGRRAIPTSLPPGSDVTACLSATLPLPMLERIGGVAHLHAEHTFRVDEHRATLR